MTDTWRRWLMRALILGIWTGLGVWLASQAYLIIYSAVRAGSDLPQGIPNPTWVELLRIHLAESYIWAVLALVIFWLARRWPFSRQRWLSRLVIHLGACLVLAFVQSALSMLVSEWLREEIPKPTMNRKVLEFFFLAKLHQNVFIYWVIFGVFQGLDYYRKFRDRELRASQLEARLAQAQLQVLKMQLHPHFLYNTLNAISALIHQDVEVADRMIARLGDLLRSTLENAMRQEVPLQQELDFIQPYLEIEQARLGPRLTVALDIDAVARDARVPNLILQPLVENAIRHGIAPRSGPGRLEIRAWREKDRLALQVADDGPGLSDGPAHGKEGVGLANTRARLRQLYGANHRFELSNGPGCGLQVTVSIPFRESNGDDDGENSDLDRG